MVRRQSATVRARESAGTPSNDSTSLMIESLWCKKRSAIRRDRGSTVSRQMHAGLWMKIDRPCVDRSPGDVAGGVVGVRKQRHPRPGEVVLPDAHPPLDIGSGRRLATEEPSTYSDDVTVADEPLHDVLGESLREGLLGAERVWEAEQSRRDVVHATTIAAAGALRPELQPRLGTTALRRTACGRHRTPATPRIGCGSAPIRATSGVRTVLTGDDRRRILTPWPSS